MKSSQSNESNSRKQCRKKTFRKLFTFEEDSKLLSLVEKYNNNWKKISSEMKNRSVRQCKERYFHYLSPDIKREDWTNEEDMLLLESVKKHGKKWKMFEELLTGRTEIDIRNRFNVLTRRIAKKIRKESLSSNICVKTNINDFMENTDINDQQICKKELKEQYSNTNQNNSEKRNDDKNQTKNINKPFDDLNFFANAAENFGSDISDSAFEEYMSEFCY